VSLTVAEPKGRSALAGALGVAALLVWACALGARAPWLGIIGAALVLGAFAAWRPTIRWQHALTGLLVVVLFIPIRRYHMPGGLPFQAEPYRVLVAVLICGWVLSLLIDRRVRIRRTGLEGPILAVVAAVLLSIVANPERVTPMQTQVVKTFTFFVSYLLVVYFVVSVVRPWATADVLVKTLVSGGAVIAVLAAIESRTGWSPFTHLNSIVPFLRPDAGADPEIARGARLRAFGPAEHPIALSAALVLLVPLAVYLLRTGGRRWWLPFGALVLGTLSTVSRTGIVMLLVVALVFLWLRPRETRRMWPLLVPLLVATQLLLPGTLGTLKASFFPQGGLIESQRALAGSCSSSGRIADLGPSLREWSQKPIFGQGFGTRMVDGPNPNACILDDQWLGTLLELGAVGFLAWLWLCVAAIRRLGRRARSDPSPRGWLLAATAASVAAFSVGMLTYDAISFIQVTFLFFVILAIGLAQARLAPATKAELELTRPAGGRPVAT
jgi:O-Antigen ligase